MEENKRKLEPDDPEQSARFIEIAERVQEESAQESFERAIGQILPPKDIKKSQPES